MPNTPGPWTIEEYGDDDCPALVIHRDTESRVCFMATPGSHGDPERITADAKLIAAAPDLLAACQSLQVYARVQVERHFDATDTPIWSALLRAIAKATT